MPGARVERVTRHCATCGAAFAVLESQIKKPGMGRYCSRPCIPKPARVECICRGCGDTFAVKVSDITKGRGKYCSVACRPDHPRDHIARTCAQCGKGFDLKPSQIHARAGRGTYCSRKCQTIAKTKPKPPKQLALPFAPPVRQCDRCGTEYRPKSPDSRYCSKACFVVPRVSGTCRGCGKAIEYNPRFPKAFCSNACHLSSYPPSQQAERDSAAVRAWRTKVLRRDGYTCQHCGVQDKPLEAHHIQPWAQYPELRTVLSNGLCLCESCHAAVHYSHAA